MTLTLEVKAEPTADNPEADIFVRDEGSLVLFYPNTPSGKEWTETHLPEETPRFGNGYAVESRYAPDIILGLIEDGLFLSAGVPEYNRTVR